MTPRNAPTTIEAARHRAGTAARLGGSRSDGAPCDRPDRHCLL